MKHKDYDLQHRNYYIDHPTSINHQQPYITSLQNQYSILNRVRNPYHVLDHCNFQLKTKEQQPLIYSSLNKKSAVNESLVKEVRQWSRRQVQKQNSYRNLKDQISDLSKIVKIKQAQSQLEKLKLQMRNQQRIPFLPSPMLMPFGMGCQFMGNSYCQCNCRCKCQGNNFRKSTPIRKYSPIKTQQLQLQPQHIQSKISKISAEPVTQQSLSKVKSQPKMRVQTKQIVRLQKKKKSNLLRRFRICAYAVYFCIYFKWFSFQFSINRYNRFKEKYLVDRGLLITEAYKQVYKKMLEVDIPELIRQAAKNVPATTIKKKEYFDISTLIKAESVVKLNGLSSFRLLTKNYQTLFLRCADFIVNLFDELKLLFENWQWDKYGESLGVGALNKTFLIDNYFLPHQIYLMVIHQGKGYAQIRSQHERSQIMVKFVAKILLFNVCLQLDNNREWLEQHENQLEAKRDQSQIFILLEISSKILFITTQLLYQQVLGDVQPNYDEVSERFRIQPCNPLVYSHSIRKRRQLFKDQNLKQSNLIIYGIENLDQVNKIIQQEFFNQSKNKITNVLNQFVDFFLDKLNVRNKQLYDDLWEQTLNHDYIILRGIKKIMRSSRFFPFATQTVTRKRNLNSREQNNGELKRTLSKKSIKIKRSNKNVQPSIQLSNNCLNKLSSIMTKVSIKNMIGHNK